MSVPVTRSGGLRAFVTADAVGGVWQYALDLASGLRPQGVETVLAVLGPPPTADQRAEAERAGVTLIETGLPLDWTASRPEEVEEASWAVARLATEAEPDLVHLNSPALAAGALFPAPVVAVAHSCVATWWAANRTGPLPEEFLWRTDLARRGYRAADRVLAPTEAFAAATQRTYGLGEAPRVVRNGRRSVVGPRIKGDPFVFTAGRLWDEGKNLAALDRAAPGILAPVLAAGPLEGPNGARVTPAHLQPLGRLDDAGIAERLGAGPIFVSMARYEPFGLAVLEAAQAGCALVLSDIPTFRELWEGAALFVPAEDDSSLTEAVNGLLRDGEARLRLGGAARQRAQTYSLDAMSAGVLAAYRQVLSPWDLDEADHPSRGERAASARSSIPPVEDAA